MKRLRYLLDPLPGQPDETVQLAGPLQQLQDALGEVQDAVVYEEQLAAARKVARREQERVLSGQASATGSPSEDPRPGLVELSRRLTLRKEAAFARLESGWLRGRSEDFFTRLNAVAESLLHTHPGLPSPDPAPAAAPTSEV